MIHIGVFAPHSKPTIIKCIKELLSHSHKRYICLTRKIDNDTFNSLSFSDIAYSIIDLETVDTGFVDILIFDATNNSHIQKVIRHICPDTHLIYNIDNGFPTLSHPHAISYGMCQSATATISSISDSEFIFCLQNPLITLTENYVGESEILVRTNEYSHDISSYLPTLTCGILCGLVTNDILSI